MTTMHAETPAADPDAIRWVLPGSQLPSGRLVDAPGPLGALLGDGTLRAVTTEPHGVTMWLGDGRSWRTEGDPIRRALDAALDDVGEWVLERDEDATLRAIAQDVLAGPVGDYIRSHGGLVSIVGAHDGELEVAFEGACSGCPASGVTLHTRLETAVRERFPALALVRDVAACAAPRRPTLWPRRRHHEGH